MLKLSSELCSGCTACVSACPQKCIAMLENEEGFLSPKLIDKESCIECGICDNVCPVLNLKQEKQVRQQGFIVQHKDIDIRMESTSGGAFTAISEYIIDNGGIVYGAAYGENFRVEHIAVEKKEDLWKFRNSKYVQSFLGEVFSQVKEYLNSGRLVCFSGTPCQIEGLVSFLGKDYQNLLLVDVVCHGIGSPLIWKKYLELYQGKLPDHIYFRWKHYGYKYSTMSFFKENEEEYFGGVESDPMLRAYFSNNCDRETCYDCPFKKRYRVSDITIWDCFQPKFFEKSFDDDKGTTSVLIHSQKGCDYFSNILKSDCLKYKEVSADELVFGNNEMVGSVTKGNERDNFLADAVKMDSKDLFEKYFPSTYKTKIKKVIRLTLVRLGIYNKIKYLLFIKRRKNSK